jgi:hypothetical protein
LKAPPSFTGKSRKNLRDLPGELRGVHSPSAGTAIQVQRTR